jgi:hypothetical protein
MDRRRRGVHATSFLLIAILSKPIPFLSQKRDKQIAVSRVSGVSAMHSNDGLPPPLLTADSRTDRPNNNIRCFDSHDVVRSLRSRLTAKCRQRHLIPLHLLPWQTGHCRGHT